VSEPRLKSGFWVAAALRLSDSEGRPGAVLRRGDADSGGILVVLRAAHGLVVLSQIRAASGDTAWLRSTGPEPVDQATADAYLARQLAHDPDLWIVEFDAPDLLPPFASQIL